jgi:antitoxin HicB
VKRTPNLEGTWMNYPVELIPDDNDTIMVAFPDVPGAISFGETEGEALANAQDALETVFSGMIADRKDIPEPSAPDGRPTVRPTLLGLLKLTVYRAMRERGWRKADLARATHQHPRQIDRLLDLRHGSTIAQIEQALAACGVEAAIEARELAAA